LVLDIRIPKLNTVDVSYTLVEWLFTEGEVVPADAPVAVLETSKAAQELVCDRGGVLHRIVEAPAECPLGTVIGHIFESEDERGRFLSAHTEKGPSQESPGEAEPVVTKYALDLMTRHGITANRVRTLGKKIVKSADVERLVAESGSRAPAPDAEHLAAESGSRAPAPDAERLAAESGSRAPAPDAERLAAPSGSRAPAPDAERLAAPSGSRAPAGEHIPSRAQRAVATVVTRAHQTIPAAFSVIKVHAADGLTLRLAFAERDGITIGFPELLVKCVASLHAAFPLFFASVRADGSAALSAQADVGVTVDVGTGLYIPVVRDAARTPMPHVASTLMEFRVKALRGQFEETDLTGGNITISLHDDAGIVLAQPLILPPHACMLTLGATQDELCLADSGEVRTRAYFNLGLAYDHRVINGRDAALFLTGIKRTFESPSLLRGLCEHDREPHDW
jgi:2-oxoglutarate dehydrogenase E2 component (dihydrolipoamide succinyltransferase)